ncbi:MAG: hypothetical protein KDH94_06510 [Coxiellaceae bacterium]|nr:hypothetical protein [Coxiellaceae bacterium]
MMWVRRILVMGMLLGFCNSFADVSKTLTIEKMSDENVSLAVLSTFNILKPNTLPTIYNPVQLNKEVTRYNITVGDKVGVVEFLLTETLADNTTRRICEVTSVQREDLLPGFVDTNVVNNAQSDLLCIVMLDGSALTVQKRH